jgi:autotransporter-associated beta strand protein
MNNTNASGARRVAIFVVTLCLSVPAYAATTANWIGSSGGEWNTTANWDIGVPGVGTNAFLPASTTVNYTLPMASPNFGQLSVFGTLNVGAAGFTIDEAATTTPPILIATNAALNVAANGVVTVTNAAGLIWITNAGSLTIAANAALVTTNSGGSGGMNVGIATKLTSSKGAAVTISSGGVLTLEGLLSIAGTGGRVTVNGGTLNCLGGSRVYDTQLDTSPKIAVNGGVANVGNFSVYRTDTPSGSGLLGGLLLTNGVVNATAIQIGTGNSMAFSGVYGGVLTNTGLFTISDTPNVSASGERRSQFYVRGGTVVSTSSDGIIIANQSGLSSSPSAGGGGLGGVLDISAGTVITEKITLVKDNTITNAYAGFFLSGNGTVYLGSGGLVLNTGAGHVGTGINLSGGTLAAKADWSSSAKMALTNNVTFKAADLTGTAHNISLSGTLSGSGNLTKTGGGTLTLSGANTFAGNTAVSAGTLVLGRSGAIPNGTGLTLGASGAIGTLDLAGFNAQVSSLATGSGAIAANQIISNSSTVNAATLTFSNSAATSSSFGGIIADGARPVALTIQGGNLTLTGANTYSGNTTINQGSLILGAAGSIANSPSIVVGTNAGAKFDVSAISGFALPAGITLSGCGVVAGSVTAPNCSIMPGAAGGTGTLTFTNDLALSGTTAYFDLALDPNSPGNDLIVVGGTLNVSGVNTIQLNPLGGTLLAGTYKLFKYGSLGSGSAANFQLAGTIGTGLEAALKVAPTELDLVVSQGEGTSFVWQGDGAANLWDLTSTNWLLGLTPMVFTNGSFVAFNDSTANTIVNLVGPLSPAGLTVDAAADYTFTGAGKVTGPLSFNKINSGALIILTTNDYSGVTTINQGTIQVGNGVVSGSLGSGSIINEATLVMAQPNNSTLNNPISGTGTLIQTGSSTLTLTASNSYIGGTTISAGALQIATGGTLGTGGVTNNALLIFNSSSNVAIGDIVSGSGSLAVSGSGTLTLTGNNTYSGGTSLTAGTLMANSPVGSATGIGAVTAGGSAKLSGTGVIAGPVTINSGGTFVPGNPTGTLTINGNLTLAPGAILSFALGTNSAGAIVAGDLNLSGTLNVTNAGGLSNSTNTLFTYSGNLTLGALTLGSLPKGYLWSIDTTNTPGKVNLIVGAIATNVASFPGALGFGSYATGGRGGSVYHVTTLNDSGTGSFRDAVSAANRIVVFDVGGYINLSSAVSVKKNITIAGQTAPGGGIGFSAGEISFANSSNIICRYIRIRPGDNTDSTTDDGLSLYDAQNIIVDHVSVEFAPYDNIDGVSDDWQNLPVTSITFQNCIIADPTGQQFGAHTECVNGTWSWFNNIFANSHNRNPLAKENTVFINNVLYNCSAGYTTHTSTPFSHDIVNNYFIGGPAYGGSSDFPWFQMDANQSIYYSGNLCDVDMDGKLDGSPTTPYWYSGTGTILSAPWSSWTTKVTVYSPATAYHRVVSQAGDLPRDQIDSLVMSQVQTLGSGATGTGAGTTGPDGNLYTSQTQTGLGNSGYGVIAGGTTSADADGDGMPDYWETALGLNPNNANDATNLTLSGYTQLEVYLNWLGAPHAVAPGNSYVDIDLWQFTSGFTNSAKYGVSKPTNGAVTLLADQHTARFAPGSGFSGLGSFDYAVTNGDGSVASDTISVLVTNAPRTAPVFLSPVANTNIAINVGVALTVTNIATDSTSSTLTYACANLPAYATFDTNSGIFTWRPSVSQAGTTNPILVTANDGGTPNLSATQSYTVTVNPLIQPTIGSPVWSAGHLSLTINGQAGPDYIVSVSTNLVDWTPILTNTPSAMPFQWTDPDAAAFPVRFYRVLLGPLP